MLSRLQILPSGFPGLIFGYLGTKIFNQNEKGPQPIGGGSCQPKVATSCHCPHFAKIAHIHQKQKL
jgi:hypothetical protein